MRSHVHQAIVQVVNRTIHPLEVMWDGTPHVLPPGYVLAPKVEADGTPVLLPNGDPVIELRGAGPNGEPLSKPMLFFAAEAAKRQNPIMGTLDPQHHLSYETLVGVIEWGDDVSHVEQADAEELLDRSLLPPDRQDVVRQYVPGARKTSSDRERAKRRALYSAGNSGNPTGMRGEYAGGAVYDR